MALARARAKKEADEKKRSLEHVDIEILRPGDATNFPKKGDSIAIHYIGYLEDGTMIDNSYNRGQPAYFILGAGQVLRGWENVLPVLSKGEKARIKLNPELAYGDQGYPPVIPPRSTLIFEIELLQFTSAGAEERQIRLQKSTSGTS